MNNPISLSSAVPISAWHLPLIEGRKAQEMNNVEVTPGAQSEKEEGRVCAWRSTENSPPTAPQLITLPVPLGLMPTISRTQ